jgi:hypothetical protein
MIRQQEPSSRSPRLSEILFEVPIRNFGSLAALPSNVQAIESVLMFATGLHAFVALVGPSGWGKSHLLEAGACRFAQDSCLLPEILSAEDWLDRDMKGDVAGPVILDNVQEALERGRTRQMLRVALERRVRRGKPTLLSFTANRPNRQIRSLLPSVREWIVSSMPAPEPAERVVVVQQMATAEGVRLSQSLIRVMAYKMKGNGRTLAGALKRLKLYGADWSVPGAFLRALGILDPFFADNSGWDLRERVLKAVECCGSMNARLSERDLAVYLMLRQAGLSELSVARFLAIEPAAAYLKASEVEAALAADPRLRTCMERSLEQVAESLGVD